MAEQSQMAITKGIGLMLISTIFFALMNALVKYLSALGYSSMENIFFRAFFMVLFLWWLFSAAPTINRFFPYLKIQKPKIRSKKRGGFIKILIRSFFGAVSMSLAFYNFATIPLGVATAFLQSMPIFMVIFTFFTREKPSTFVIIATFIGFVGVLLIANPQISNISPINAFAGIIGAISACFAFMTLRSLKEYYESGAVVLWYGICMSIAGALGMLIPIEKMGGFVMPNVYAICIFLLCGLMGAAGQWCMTSSYMFAPAGIVAPISYMRIVWSLFLGFMLGDLFPSWITLAGIGLIIASGILIALPVFIKEYRKIYRQL